MGRIPETAHLLLGGILGLTIIRRGIGKIVMYIRFSLYLSMVGMMLWLSSCEASTECNGDTVLISENNAGDKIFVDREICIDSDGDKFFRNYYYIKTRIKSIINIASLYKNEDKIMNVWWESDDTIFLEDDGSVFNYHLSNDSGYRIIIRRR